MIRAFAMVYRLYINLVDMTTVINRGLMQAIYNVPAVISMFVAPIVAGVLLSKDQWRWGYGITPILLFITGTPLIVSLWHIDLKVRKILKSEHENEKVEENRALLHKILWVINEVDLIGSLLLVAGLCLILLPLVLGNTRWGGWGSSTFLYLLYFSKLNFSSTSHYDYHPCLRCGCLDFICFMGMEICIEAGYPCHKLGVKNTYMGHSSEADYLHDIHSQLAILPDISPSVSESKPHEGYLPRKRTWDCVHSGPTCCRLSNETHTHMETFCMGRYITCTSWCGPNDTSQIADLVRLLCSHLANNCWPWNGYIRSSTHGGCTKFRPTQW